jgi:hypothetical protein
MPPDSAGLTLAPTTEKLAQLDAKLGILDLELKKGKPPIEAAFFALASGCRAARVGFGCLVSFRGSKAVTSPAAYFHIHSHFAESGIRHLFQSKVGAIKYQKMRKIDQALQVLPNGIISRPKPPREIRGGWG